MFQCSWFFFSSHVLYVFHPSITVILLVIGFVHQLEGFGPVVITAQTGQRAKEGGPGGSGSTVTPARLQSFNYWFSNYSVSGDNSRYHYRPLCVAILTYLETLFNPEEMFDVERLLVRVYNVLHTKMGTKR